MLAASCNRQDKELRPRRGATGGAGTGRLGSCNRLEIRRGFLLLEAAPNFATVVFFFFLEPTNFFFNHVCVLLEPVYQFATTMFSFCWNQPKKLLPCLCLVEPVYHFFATTVLSFATIGIVNCYIHFHDAPRPTTMCYCCNHCRFLLLWCSRLLHLLSVDAGTMGAMDGWNPMMARRAHRREGAASAAAGYPRGGRLPFFFLQAQGERERSARGRREALTQSWKRNASCGRGDFNRAVQSGPTEISGRSTGA